MTKRTPLESLELKSSTRQHLARWMGDAGTVESIDGQPRIALEAARFSSQEIGEIHQSLQAKGFGGITGAQKG